MLLIKPISWIMVSLKCLPAHEKKDNVEHLISEFHARLDMISELNLNDRLKCHLLLLQANLDYHD